MNISFLFALCFLPVVTFFIIFSIFPKEKQILKYLIFCVLGVLTIIPASFIQFFVLKLPFFNSSTFSSILITSIIFNGLIEECFKMGFMILMPKRNMTLTTFFIGAILLGISAGSIETAIYVMGNIEKVVIASGTEEAIKLIFTRMFSTQSLHAFCAGLSGIFVWSSRKGLRHLIIFIYAVIFHGFFNFFIAFDTSLKYFAIVPILLAAIECRIWYKNAKNSEILPENTI